MNQKTSGLREELRTLNPVWALGLKPNVYANSTTRRYINKSLLNVPSYQLLRLGSSTKEFTSIA